MRVEDLCAAVRVLNYACRIDTHLCRKKPQQQKNKKLSTGLVPVDLRFMCITMSLK
jgi:hypothetical protein